MKTIVLGVITLSVSNLYILPNSNRISGINYTLQDKALHAVELYTISPAYVQAINMETDTIMVNSNDTLFKIPIKVQ